MIARELIDEINKVDVVSFVVFDTLISRLCLEPRDVFFFAATKFIKETRLPLFPSTIAKYRELAESECRKKKAEGEVTLDEIYLKLNEALHLSENELASLKNSEIATEYAVTVSLDDRKEILLYALEKRKEVILVSDMYLPKLVIMSLLERNSYPVSKLKLYVSSEINKTKRDGTIFKYISERINGKEGEGKKFLHIGDSYESDIVRAKESGWLAWGVPNLNEQFLANSVKSSPLVRFKLNYSYSASILGGIFSKTQKSNDCFSDGSIEGLGYYCLGPLLYGFLEWLSERLVEKPVDRVLFLARDGYIMKKGLNKISPYSQ